jgi:hypothetical protein
MKKEPQRERESARARVEPRRYTRASPEISKMSIMCEDASNTAESAYHRLCHDLILLRPPD